MIELPTPANSVWINPAFVIAFTEAEEGRTFLYVEDRQYTILLPPDQVAALLAGQAPAKVEVATT